MRGRSEPSKTNSIFNAIYNYFISCCGYTCVDVECRPVSDTKRRSISKNIVEINWNPMYVYGELADTS